MNSTVKTRDYSVLWLLLAISGCGALGTDGNTYDYPTRIDPLTSEQQVEYQAKLDFLKPSYFSSYLNDYGFLEIDIISLYSNPTHDPIDDEALMITRAKQALVNLSDFTGVRSITALKVGESRGILGCVICDGSDRQAANTSWLISFGDQEYGGLEVQFTSIDVYLDADKVVAVEGHWYPDIVVPAKDKVSWTRAANSLEGYQLEWAGFGGEPHTFTIESGSITPQPEKVILPVEEEEYIEVRVAWRIGIRLSSHLLGWHILVDTTTGEIIQVWQLFVT